MYIQQPTTNNKLTSGRLLLLSTMAIGRWISMTTKRDKTNLVSSLFSLYATWFIRQVSVGWLLVRSGNRNCHGQHGLVGVIFTKFEKEATRRQSIWIKLYRLLPIILLLLRIMQRGCWLVVALGETERCHSQSDAQRFCFCCLMHDARARKRFLINWLTLCWRKGAPTLDLKKYCLYLLLHE
jgi:hypothetical protein